MESINKNKKTQNLEKETIAQIEKLALSSEKTLFETLIDKIDLTTENDEKFILMLISILHKKCSSELTLALLYILS